MKLIKFSQDRCVPCQILGNYLSDKGIDYEEKHVDELPTFGLNIMGSPVLLLAEDNNTPIDFTVGFNPGNTSDVDRLVSQL